jgi:hypothetical protein
MPTMNNLSASGRTPAQGDDMRAEYVYSDLDGDLESPSLAQVQWFADTAAIPGATARNFLPTAAQNKKFLTVRVQPGSMPPADPNMALAAVTSAVSLSPVLPPRAQLAAAYSRAPNSQRWGDAYMHCAGQGARLPSIGELQILFTTYTRANAAGVSSEDDLNRTYGWAKNVYWTTSGDGSRHTYLYIHEDGRSSTNNNEGSYGFACAKTGTPELLPSVTAASVPAAAVGTPVTAVYTYKGNATIPDRSRFQWYTATASNGTTGKTAIAGATAASYTPVAADANKWLVVEITPASYDTVVGVPVTAVGTPAVSNITLTGLAIEMPKADRGSFQVNYTFTGGTEAGTTYQWYWKGAAVSGATAKTFTFPSLTIPSATVAEELKVEVTPRTSTVVGALAATTRALKSSIAWSAPLGQGTWYDMARTCANQSNGNKRPGTTAELQSLVTSLGHMGAYGVATGNSYWTGTKGGAQGTHQIVQLANGAMSNSVSDSGTGERGLCVAGTAAAPPSLGNADVNGHSFANNLGFPWTGFEGANFGFSGVRSSQNWTHRSTDTSKFTVDQDTGASIRLKAKGSAIYEVYNVAGGHPTTYNINIRYWFYNKNFKGNRTNARSKCQAGTNLPWYQHLTASKTNSAGPRAVGSLQSEWGNMGSFGWTINNGYYWTDSDYGASNAYIVRLDTGALSNNAESTTQNTVCME